MPVLREKHLTYRVGGVFVALGCVVYSVVFGLPTWERVTIDTGIDVTGGLWQHTCYGITDCSSYDVVLPDPVFETARSLACIALAVGAVSLISIFIHNCTAYARGLQHENIVVSVAPTISGILGIGACILYVFTVQPANEDENFQFHLEWGFYAGLAGESFVTVGGILMLIGIYWQRRLFREDSNNTITQSTSTFQLQQQHLQQHLQQQHLQQLYQQSSSASTEPMALVAVPVSYLTPASSHTNLSIAGTAPSSSGRIQGDNLTLAKLTHLQSPATALGQSASCQPPSSASASNHNEPRVDPSAPPLDLYY